MNISIATSLASENFNEMPKGDFASDEDVAAVLSKYADSSSGK